MKTYRSHPAELEFLLDQAIFSPPCTHIASHISSSLETIPKWFNIVCAQLCRRPAFASGVYEWRPRRRWRRDRTRLMENVVELAVNRERALTSTEPPHPPLTGNPRNDGYRLYIIFPSDILNIFDSATRTLMFKLLINRWRRYTRDRVAKLSNGRRIR